MGKLELISFVCIANFTMELGSTGERARARLVATTRLAPRVLLSIFFIFILMGILNVF